MTESLSRRFNEALNDEMQAALDKWDREAMVALIEKGADVNQMDRHGHTPFIFAAINGDLPFAQLLVSKGADLAATRVGKLNALSVSVTNGHMDILRLMANAGVDLDAKDGFGYTAMDWAKSKDFGSEEKAKTLQDIIEARARRDTAEQEKSRRDAFDSRQQELKDTAKRRRPTILP